MTVLGIKSDPFQQSSSQQLPVDRGAGGRGEALGYIYIYILVYMYISAGPFRGHQAEEARCNLVSAILYHELAV